MLRFAQILFVSAVLATGPRPNRPAAAWPHRAFVTALHARPVAFRAYTRGGTLIIAVDSSGRRTAAVAASAGTIDRVSATGHQLVVRLVADKFVIESR
jgi:hypothetical protein